MNLKRIEFFEANAGSDIKDSIREALEYSEKNDCIVKFNFNSVKMEISRFKSIQSFDEQMQEYYNFYEKTIQSNIDSTKHLKDRAIQEITKIYNFHDRGGRKEAQLAVEDAIKGDFTRLREVGIHNMKELRQFVGDFKGCLK